MLPFIAVRCSLSFVTYDLFHSCRSVYMFHTSTVCDRWYKHYLRKQRVFTPPQKPFVPENDWESVPYKITNPNEFMKSVQSLPAFLNLNDQHKTLFTYKYVYKKDEFNEKLNMMLEQLGYHPTDQSLPAKVIQMTMQLRYKKSIFEKNPRCTNLRAALKALIAARRRALHLLRATNFEEFQRLTKFLSITGYQFPDPYYIPSDDPNVERKRTIREECYQIRLKKLLNLKTKFISSQSEFYTKKQVELEKILQDLMTLVNKNEMQIDNYQDKQDVVNQLLRNLFQEVVQERQVEVLNLPESDKFSWYAKEAVNREKYLLAQAQKAEKVIRRVKK